MSGALGQRAAVAWLLLGVLYDHVHLAVHRAAVPRLPLDRCLEGTTCSHSGRAVSSRHSKRPPSRTGQGWQPNETLYIYLSILS